MMWLLIPLYTISMLIGLEVFCMSIYILGQRKATWHQLFLSYRTFLKFKPMYGYRLGDKRGFLQCDAHKIEIIIVKEDPILRSTLIRYSSDTKFGLFKEGSAQTELEHTIVPVPALIYLFLMIRYCYKLSRCKLEAYDEASIEGALYKDMVKIYKSMIRDENLTKIL